MPISGKSKDAEDVVAYWNLLPSSASKMPNLCMSHSRSTSIQVRNSCEKKPISKTDSLQGYDVVLTGVVELLERRVEPRRGREFDHESHHWEIGRIVEFEQKGEKRALVRKLDGWRKTSRHGLGEVFHASISDGSEPFISHFRQTSTTPSLKSRTKTSDSVARIGRRISPWLTSSRFPLP